MISNRFVILLAVAAAILGVASPLIAGLAIDGDMRHVPFLYDWVSWLPGVVGYWFWLESDMAFMALSMTVYAAQYFAAFMLVALLAPLVRDFIRPHKHRAGLAGRRA